jgi:ATP-dependent helicase/nuclease subunit A
LIVAAAGNVSDTGESWYKKIEKGLVDLAAKTTPFPNGGGLCYRHGEWLFSQSSGELAKKEKTVKLPPYFYRESKYTVKM